MSEDNVSVEETEHVVAEPEGFPVGDFNSIMAQPTDEYTWVDVPEWKCKVKIKSLTKAEQIKLRKVSSVRGVVDDTKLEQNLLVYSLVEPRLTFDQVDQLYTKANAKAVSRLQAAALTFSGLTEDYIGMAEADMKS